MSGIIKVDSREPVHVKKQLKKQVEKSSEDLQVEVEELETGDFVFEDVVFERKTGKDFLNSTNNRRLSKQADRMVEQYKHCFVVVEEYLWSNYAWKYTQMPKNSVMGQQISLAVKRGIRILSTEDAEMTCYAVRRAVERFVNGDERETGYVKTHSTGEVDDVQVAMLMQIDGISRDKANEIIYESGLNIGLIGELARDYERGGLEMLENELKCIDGIGPTLADRIINAFN